MKTSDKLIEARELIYTRSRWTKFRPYRRADNYWKLPAAYCLTGALNQAIFGSPTAVVIASSSTTQRRCFRKCVQSLYVFITSDPPRKHNWNIDGDRWDLVKSACQYLISYNDEARTTHKDIITLFDWAIGYCLANGD